MVVWRDHGACDDLVFVGIFVDLVVYAVVLVVGVFFSSMMWYNDGDDFCGGGGGDAVVIFWCWCGDVRVVDFL